MSIVEVLEALGQHPQLKIMEFKTLSQYIRLIPHLRNLINLPQPIGQSMDDCGPPEFLPPSIVEFFSRSFGLSQDNVQNAWEILKNVGWESELVALTQDDYDIFKLYGWDLGISKLYNR